MNGDHFLTGPPSITVDGASTPGRSFVPVAVAFSPLPAEPAITGKEWRGRWLCYSSDKLTAFLPVIRALFCRPNETVELYMRGS